jgi:hypothetical protein
MKWTDRSPEIAYLLNPAFCCTLLTSSVIEYNNINSKGMSFPLAFMILPLVLTKPIRDTLPRSKSTPLADWVETNSHLRGVFYDRTISMKSFTQEALLFGFSYEWLELNKKGIIESKIKQNKLNHYFNDIGEEAKKCISKSRLIGKWFASAGSAQTVMTLWGIKP